MKKYVSKILILLTIFILLTGGCYLYLSYLLNQFHEKGVKKSDIDHLYNTEQDSLDINNDDNNEEQTGKDEQLNDKSSNEDQKNIDPYFKMIEESDRINILCLGIPKSPPLADTIIVVSLDPKKQLVDIISVPRDTYYYREGYERPGQKKINASYIGKNSAAKAQSTMNAVRDVLRIPIHYFVKIEYEGVENIVDYLEGVEVNIRFDMNYDDPIDNLHIHFVKGKHLLDGDEAVRYLRFRKNNDGSHSDGDIGRINRQQEFIINALNKSLGLEFVGIINIAKEYIKTSMTSEKMIFYANKFRKINRNNINTYILPGRSKTINGAGYYSQYKEKTKEMITQIYSK